MKTKIFISLILTVLFSALLSAQLHRVTTELATGKHYNNSGGDSMAVGSSSVVVTATGGQAGVAIDWTDPLSGATLFPDSIRVTAVASTDTVAGKLYFKAFVNGTTVVSRDSVLVLTAKGFASALVPRSSYIGKDYMNLAWSANASGNGTTSTNKLFARVTRWFTLIK
jgi:hypothetical protein